MERLYRDGLRKTYDAFDHVATLTDAVGNQFTGDGQFSGFFSEPGPASNPDFPGGAGLTYSLQDLGSNIQVSGAAAFGDP